MNERRKAVAEEELQAYVDGRLNAARHDRVAAAVASDPELARRAKELRDLNDAMHCAFDAMLDKPVPPEMLRTVMERRPLPMMFRVAATVAWMIIGGVLGGLAVHRLSPDPGADVAAVRPLAREAAYAHAVYAPEVRHPVEVRADQRTHLNTWLSKRLSQPVTAPDVRGAGYQLVGGRLLPDAGRPAAQFMYEDDHGARLTLYVRVHSGPAESSAIRHADIGGVGVVYWIDGPLAYALVGGVEKAELETVARAMYAALNP